MEGPTQLDKRGKTVATHKAIETWKDCTELCEGNQKCHSFLYHVKNKVCTLKDLALTGSEPIVKKNPNFFSVYKFCKEGNYCIYNYKILNHFIFG